MEEQNKTEEAKKAVEETLKKFFSISGGEAADPDTMIKHAGQHDLKQLMEEFQAISVTGQRHADLWFHRIFADLHSHALRMNGYAEQVFSNVLTHCKDVDSRNLLHVPTHDFAFNRTWTLIDELVASLTAKTGLQQDVVVTLLIKILTDIIAPKLAEASEVTGKKAA